MPAAEKKRKWSQTIKTASTFPPPGTFKEKAKIVARTMASKKVSPKGIGSGIKMVQMFINRAGKKLDPAQRRELEKAKRILQQKKADEEEKTARSKRVRPKKPPSKMRTT